jgi:predicted Zn-dependent protease
MAVKSVATWLLISIFLLFNSVTQAASAELAEAQALMAKKNYAAALPLYQKELQIQLKQPTQNQTVIINLQADLSELFTYLEQPENAYLAAQQAHLLWKNHPDYQPQPHAVLLNNMAQMAMYFGDMPKATQYFSQAILYARKANETAMADGITQNLSKISTIQTPEHYTDYLIPPFELWDDSHRRIKVYINPDLPQVIWSGIYDKALKQSFADWSQATENMFTFEFVTDPDLADCIIVIKETIGHATELGRNNRQQFNSRKTGTILVVNDLELTLRHNQPESDDYGNALTTSEFLETCRHEVGHMLGLYGHSPNPGDIMSNGNIINLPWAKRISPRDINTLKHLYTSENIKSIKTPANIPLHYFVKTHPPS